MPSPFKPAHATPAASWGVLDTILLTALVGQLDAPLAERYIRDLTRLQRHVPPRSIGGSIAFIASGAGVPSAEVREILARAPKTGNIVNVGTSIVIDGEGFRASVVRAVTTGIAMLNRAAPFRAFSTMHEGIGDLERRVRAAGGTTPPEDALVDAMRTLREACERAA